MSLICSDFNDTLKVNNTTNYNAPFKATKIWNDILQGFFLGMQVGSHKRGMKTYYDCFTATQAVTWLKNYLINCEHFQNKKVTRFQALNLLRKYHKSNLIEPVKPSKKGKELQDNHELFRFSPNANENLPFLKTSKSEADLLESCSAEQYEKIEINLNEKISCTKQTVWQQILSLLPNICDFIKCEQIDGQSLYNNITRLNANGVVQLTDKSQDLPHWIMSAMKCLANWPKASGSGNCLPKYPGFESDVFNLIRDYFTNIEEPIIPFEFYYIIINSFEKNSKLTTRDNMSSFVATSTLKNENGLHLKNELNLPSNCVYETVFSGSEPVTKIVPIDELSGVFPNIMDYFQEHTKQSTFSKRFNSCVKTSSTFKAISTMPRNTSSKLNTQVNLSTPKKMEMFSDILYLDSPPEAGEYMLEKDTFTLKYHSLHRARQINTNSMESRKHYLLQLILLTLPTANRRHLQLLIRLFHKIIHNKELCLLTKDSFELKKHIVNIFTRSILMCHKENDYNELKAKEFVTFLIDQCVSIFLIPEELSKEIEKTINNAKARKTPIANSFFKKISNDEFEMQRDVLSERALSELMESIMSDNSMSERDKLKWIKQFKLYHPDVYDVYVTNCNPQINNEQTSYDKAFNTTNRRTISLGPTTFLAKSKFVKRFLSLKF